MKAFRQEFGNLAEERARMSGEKKLSEQLKAHGRRLTTRPTGTRVPIGGREQADPRDFMSDFPK